MKRKWWKFLLPVPFIFCYCYCVSFPGRGERNARQHSLDTQQESQDTQESTRTERTVEPPPAPPAELGAQSPPAPSEEAVAPVPEAHIAEAQETSPVENEPPQVVQIEIVPPQSTSKSSMPPPLSPAATQALSLAPAMLDPAPAPAVETKAENEEVIIALAALSALESEGEQELSPVIPTSEQQQELPPLLEERDKKQKAAEYARSTENVSVSQETFEADKRRILSMINDLDVYMETGDYKGWNTCLSDESRTYWSKPQNLRKAAAKLPISGIKLNNMEDYFNYVFVPARRGHKVEEIRYVTETQVKAVQVEDDVDMVFYHFKKVNGKWRLFLPKIKD